MVEGYLSSCLSEAQRASYHKLTEAMQYSLMAGGKRLRPMLVLEFCRICGGDVEKALPLPAASRCCTPIRSFTTIFP